MERLDKLLSSQGRFTRSEAQKCIRAGRVAVNGTPCRDAAQKWDPEVCTVTVDGRVQGYEEHLYIMLHKPPGILCVSRDPRAPTVVDLLPTAWRRKGMFPAGRLDKDTVGLVILTDDGAFAHEMLSPRHHIYKYYQALLDAPVEQEHIRIFANGTSLADGTACLPAVLSILHESETPLVGVEICEGKYHQIKRMFGTIDHKVLWLKRCSIGGLALDETLKEGECRAITPAERALLLKSD